MTWQTMDSAPTDRPVLLYARAAHAEAPVRVVGSYHRELGWIEQTFAPNTPTRLVPTLWCPLPEVVLPDLDVSGDIQPLGPGHCVELPPAPRPNWEFSDAKRQYVLTGNYPIEPPTVVSETLALADRDEGYRGLAS